MTKRLIFMLAFAIAGTHLTWAQTSNGTSTVSNSSATTVSPPDERQPNKKELDCACESQVLPEALAIVNGVRITREEIENSVRDPVAQLQRQIIEARERELDLQINSKLVSLEAKHRGLSVASLLEAEVTAKVKDPTAAEVQSFFLQNKDRIQGDLNDARSDIVRYLREARETEEAKKFAARLRADGKNKVRILDAVRNNQVANRERVLAIVNEQKITSADIEDSLRPLVSAVQEQVYRLRKSELDLRINDTLLEQAAEKRKVSATALLDAEAKPKIVTEEDARAFYEQNKDRVSGDFSQTKDSIIRYLQQSELRSAELAFVERLRAAASIETFLIAPKLPVSSITTTEHP